MGIQKSNVYIPDLAVVEEIRVENPYTRTYTLRFLDPLLARSFEFLPAQGALISAFGYGEDSCFFSSSPSTRGRVEVTLPISRGVSTALSMLEKGNMVGLRAPIGNGLPLEEMRHKRIYLIGHDSGLIPLRSLANYAVDNPTEFERIVVMGSFEEDTQLIFHSELLGVWPGHSIFDVKVFCEHVFSPREGIRPGGIGELFDAVEPAPSNSYAVVSGPVPFIRDVVSHLIDRDFRDAQILVLLNRKMSCGFGICGGCKIGDRYLCLTGPVFTMAELRKLPPEF